MPAVIFKKYATITAEWGTGGAGATNLGIVNSASRKKGSEKESLLDENACTVGQIFFDFKDEISCEVTCKSNAALPSPGDNFTLCGQSGLVQDAEEKWEQKGLKKFTVNVTKFNNVLA